MAILRSAEAVFTEKGYHGASVREIGRRAGVSSALLYWFFPDKARLFSAVLQERIDTQQALEFPQDALDIPPDVLLPRIMQRFTRFITSPDQVRLMRLVLRDADREPELAAALAQVVVGRALGPLAAYFRHHMEAGTIRQTNPDFAAQAFMGMFVLLALRREIMLEPISRTWDVDAYAASTVDIFLRGILAAPDG
jgi:AcrR family transcriptional regulator